VKGGLAIVVSFCLLLAGTAAAASKDDAFTIDKRTFKKQVRVIALAPVDADLYFEMPDSVAAILEQEVTARLQKRGYTVIPSLVLAGIRKKMAAQVGGIEDPETGQINFARYQAVRNHAFRELWFQRQFDALAIIRVSVTRVDMESDRVEWDGVKQKIVHSGRSKKYAATTSVSTVSVAIYDSANKQMYLSFGGLEALVSRVDEQLLPLPVKQLFLDEKRIRKAAQIAVDPI